MAGAALQEEAGVYFSSLLFKFICIHVAFLIKDSHPFQLAGNLLCCSKSTNRREFNATICLWEAELWQLWGPPAPPGLALPSQTGLISPGSSWPSCSCRGHSWPGPATPHLWFFGSISCNNAASKASELAQISQLSLDRKAKGGKSISQKEKPPGSVSVLTSARLEVNSEGASRML